MGSYTSGAMTVDCTSGKTGLELMLCWRGALQGQWVFIATSGRGMREDVLVRCTPCTITVDCHVREGERSYEIRRGIRRDVGLVRCTTGAMSVDCHVGVGEDPIKC